MTALEDAFPRVRCSLPENMNELKKLNDLENMDDLGILKQNLT